MVLRLLLAVYCTYMALNLDEERQESRNFLFDILIFFLALDLDGQRQESRNILLVFFLVF
jgi:hypothetical protein